MNVVRWVVCVDSGVQKIKEKREKIKLGGDLTETIEAYERLGLLEGPFFRNNIRT